MAKLQKKATPGPGSGLTTPKDPPGYVREQRFKLPKLRLSVNRGLFSGVKRPAPGLALPSTKLPQGRVYFINYTDNGFLNQKWVVD
jgi:hypothetical protein